MGFFLSDLEGELEESDRGLLEEASGLEVSDFFEEKNLPLKTMFGSEEKEEQQEEEEQKALAVAA